MEDDNLNKESETKNNVPDNLPGVEVDPSETTQQVGQPTQSEKPTSQAPTPTPTPAPAEIPPQPPVVEAPKQPESKPATTKASEQPEQTDLQKEVNSDLEEAIKPLQKTPKEALLEEIQDKPEEPVKKEEPKTETKFEKEDVNADKKEITKLKSIRTYKSDLAKAMDKKRGSLVGIASAESRRRYSGVKTVKPLPDENAASKKAFRKKIGIVVLSTVLVVLGMGAIFYFYGKSNPNIATSNPKIQSIIFADDGLEFNITNLSRRQILNELTSIKERTNLSMGRIKNVFLTKSFISEEGEEKRALVDANEFLNVVDVQVPTSFLRSLQSRFMIGVHVFDGNQPFIILGTSFYENAFVGMLEWEKYLKDDLAPFFDNKKADLRSNQAATSTSDIRVLGFKDIVLKNKDVRILKDEEGETVLIYSFIDKGTIVITTNENTFTEILTRLTSSRTIR